VVGEGGVCVGGTFVGTVVGLGAQVPWTSTVNNMSPIGNDALSIEEDLVDMVSPL
jgi:hypothetical protein